MNITQIKYVLAIAASSSIREAATKLFISQPALSSSVRELEEELGILILATVISFSDPKVKLEHMRAVPI